MVRLTLAALAAAAPAIAMPAEKIFARDCSAKASFSAGSTTNALPDPFVDASGNKVTTADQWACRQKEIFSMFEQFEMGTYPGPPDKVTATMSGTGLSIAITVGSNSQTMSVTLKKGSSDAVIIAYGGASIPIPAGVGSINFNNDNCAAQSGSGSRGSGMFYKLHPNNNSGATSAWAWCVGRIIDALEQLGKATTGIDPKKVGVTGCSRNGKGAFVAGAMEPRVALTLPQESGSGGAACWRISQQLKSKGTNIQTAGELVGEDPWFSKNLDQYAKDPGVMPVDHHMLAALIAPRGLFVIENDIDWLGPGSTTPCMFAGRQIYKSLGVGSNMGFSLVGGHSHCQFPSAQTADMTSYVNQFLLGTGKNNDVQKSSNSPSMADYTGKWSNPSITLS